MNFLNLILRFRSLPDRILGLRLENIKADQIMNIDHDFMNRKLIWNTLTVKLTSKT